jgi:hypothetical protein
VSSSHYLSLHRLYLLLLNPGGHTKPMNHIRHISSVGARMVASVREALHDRVSERLELERLEVRAILRRHGVVLPWAP